MSGTGVSYKQDDPFRGEEIKVVGGETETFALFDAGMEEEVEEGRMAGIRFFPVPDAVCSFERGFYFDGGEHFWQRTEHRPLHNFFGGVNE